MRYRPEVTLFVVVTKEHLWSNIVRSAKGGVHVLAMVEVLAQTEVACIYKNRGWEEDSE